MANFLSKLFKPKWQSKHTATRLEAIKDLNLQTEEDQKILFSLAESDQQVAVRRSAISKLTDTQQLIDLHKKADADIKPLLEQKLYELANTQSLSIFDLITDNKLLTEMIIKSNQADAFITGLARIQDPESLFQMATLSKASKLRQAAAELIENETQLSALAIAAKGKDKSVFQIAKNKLSKLKNQAQAVNEQQLAIEKILSDIETHAKTEVRQHFEVKLNNIKLRWTSVVLGADDQQKARYTNAAAQCDTRVDARLKEQFEAEEQEKLIQTGGDEQEATLFTLSETLKRFRDAPASNQDISALDALIKTQENRWLEATRQIKVEKNQSKHYLLLIAELRQYFKSLKALSDQSNELEALVTELKTSSSKDIQLFERNSKQMKRALRAIDWPKEFALPELIIKCNEALGVTAELKQKIAQNTKEIQNKVTQLIAEMDAALEERQLKQSAKILKEIQRHLSKIDAKQGAQFHNQLNLRINQLNELRDWQGYASNPRQQALCEAMERLSENHSEPLEKADKIKAMQKEWKTLGGAADQTLWQRFKLAADKAYEPCQAFFEEQNQLKRNNVAKREQLIAQVSNFIENNDWQNADWKAAEKINRQARQEWKEAYPVDFKANKTIQTRFNKLLEQFDEKLDQERDRNLKLKQAIVDKANELISLDALDQAIQQAKNLQQEWQAVGIMAHKQERILWKSFREACDQIFARRDQARNDKREEIDSAIQVATTFNDDLESYIESLEDKTLEELQSALSEFRKGYKQLPSLPAKALEKNQQRYEDALKALKQSIATQENKQHLRQWQEIQRKASLCRQVFNQGLGSEAQQLEDEFNSQIVLSKQHELALKELWISTKADAVKAENIVTLDQARSVCIACEVAAGIDSPESDKELRMQLQVSRLSEGMSSTSEHKSREEQLNASLLEWYSKVGLETDIFAPLESRIEIAIQHLLAK